MFRKGLFLTGLLIAPILLSAYTSPGNPKGFVNDFAGMLKPETVTTLETTLNSFSQQTGNQISVVTVPTLGDESIETYAEKLFQEWGIGDEEKDSGLLLLVARDERELRIEVGYGLEPVITDIESSRIIREEITPAFKNSDYDAGVMSGVNRIMTDLTDGIPPVSEAPSRTSRFNPFNFFYLFVFFLMFLGSVLGRSKSWWAGGVLGGFIGVVIGFIKGFLFFGLFSIVGLSILGLLFDFWVSRAYSKHKDGGGMPPWFLGGGGFGGHGGGGFGGFGGGMSGGGGASGRW